MSHIVCVGLATVDLVHRVDKIPGADEKAQATSVEIAAGGPAANAAVTAAALGAQVTLVTAVGRHPLGALVRADLEAYGVRVIDAAPGFDGPPPVSAITVASDSGQRTIVSRNAGDMAVGVPDEGFPDADLTLVDGHHPTLGVAAARGARRLLVDAGSWRPVFAEILPLAEVVAASADFRHPAARAGTDRALAAAIGAPHVIVTHGPDPVRWFSGARSGAVPVPPVAAVDTAGAGDAFHGALAVALADADLPRPASLPPAAQLPHGIRTAASGASLPPTGLPPASLPPGSQPPGSQPPGSLPPTGLPPASLPPGSLPPGSQPPTGLPPENLPPTGLPPASQPPAGLPPENLSAASLRPASLPPASPSPESLSLTGRPRPAAPGPSGLILPYSDKSDLLDCIAFAVRVAGVRVAHAGPRAWLAALPNRA